MEKTWKELGNTGNGHSIMPRIVACVETSKLAKYPDSKCLKQEANR